MRPPSLRTCLLASVACLPLASHAQNAPNAATDAIRVLLQQASLWRNAGQADKADEALGRVLAIDPGNAEALATRAQDAAQRGSQAAAGAALTQLQAAHPDDPRIAGLQQALRIGTPDPAALAHARELARAGKSAEALAVYRQVFKGETPPPEFATEYYQTLADTPDGRPVALAALSAALRVNPNDLAAQLAYAQLLTYREATREAGIGRLQSLVRLPGQAEQAQAAWRQALIWSGDNPEMLDQVDLYLKQFPDDQAVTEIRATMAATLPDANMQLRTTGYQALAEHRQGAAEQAFATALAANPDDVDSLAMLAVIRRQQGREAEARGLIDRAVTLAPDRRDELLAALGGPGPGGAARGGDGGAAIRRAYADVARLTRRGEYAAAEAQLRRLMGRRPTAADLVQLGYIQLGAGRPADAQASFDAALTSRPGDKAAQSGLAAVMARGGDTDGAIALYAKLGDTAAIRGLEQTRAGALQDKARDAASAEEKVALYRSAIASAPSDPWLRLEFARVLLAQFNAAEARQVMAPVTEAATPSVDQVRAGMYFAEATHDDRLAADLVGRLPPRARTPEMADVEARADVAADLAEARSQATLEAVRGRMLVLAAKPDPAGDRGVAFAQELIRAGDKAAVPDVLRAALNGVAPAVAPQRIGYAGMLVAAGFPRDAVSVVAGLRPETLDTVQRSRLEQVRQSAAVVLADTLNGEGRSADAYGRLAPLLAQDPQNPGLNMALARIYQTEQQPARALAIDQTLLRDHPDDVDVRAATISAALQAGELGEAATLARETRTRFPEEPRAWMAAADVARARHDEGTALADLRTARVLRERQLAAGKEADARDSRPPPLQYAQYLPYRAASDAEPVTREYERYAQAAPASPPPAATSNSPPPAATSSPPPQDLTVPPADMFRGPAVVLPPGSRPVATERGGIPPYNNPFRATATPDEPGDTLPSLRPGPRERPPEDAVMAEIDRSIDQVSSDIAPDLQGSVVLRGRSGPSGLASLYDVSVPLQAGYSPAGYGRLRLGITPTYLNAGSASGGNLALFGTNPLSTTGVLSRGRSSATGVGLDLGYTYDIVNADVGTTPLGFQLTNVVGGVELTPPLAPGLSLSALAERRAVTDSLLSYAGERDPRTGQSWGGVVRNRGHLQLNGTVEKVTYYLGAGGGVLTGQHVPSNTEIDAGAGFSLPVWTTPTQEIRAGLDLVYFTYNKNLQAFTYGSGGYFSPHNFFAALIPVTYREHLTPDLVYGVGGTIGLQSFTEKAAPVFQDAGLQSALVQLAASRPGTAARIGATHSTGVGGGAQADIDYRVMDNLHVGARAGFDRSGNFTEGTGLVYARYVFHDQN